MANILFNTLADAENRSRELWEAYLGRPRDTADVTEFLYARQVDEVTSDVTLYIPARDEFLDELLREDQMTATELASLVNLYPDWSGNAVSYAIGDLVSYGTTLYRCVQAHTSQAGWTPDVVPALFVESAPDGVIPEWSQPTGAHDAYPVGFRVTHNAQIWESTTPANVWEPGVFGWEAVA